MYFDVSLKKFFITGCIAAVLAGAVYATFALVRVRYGESPLAQTAWRLVSGNARYVRYVFRSAVLRGSAAAVVSFSRDLAGGGTAAAVPVLAYHGIPERPDGANIPRKRFEEQMFALKRAGWETISLSEFRRFLAGETTVPEKSFVLTFDDGAKESFYPVDPLLRALDYEAVAFLLPKYSAGAGTFYYLSAAEISRMLESGRWEIGSHGLDIHRFAPIDEKGARGAVLANRLWLPDEGRLETATEYEQRISTDLAASREDLEGVFGGDVFAFAFPFGDFGHLSINYPGAPATIERLTRSSYDLALYQGWEGDGFSFNYPEEGTFMVRRISVDPQWNGKDLREVLEHGNTKDVPHEDVFAENLGWVRNWGTVSVEDDILLLAAPENESGAFTFLDGTGNWKDYAAEYEISWEKAANVMVLGRLADSGNYVACVFGDETVEVRTYTAGGRQTVAKAAAVISPGSDVAAGIRIAGGNVSCTWNGTSVLDAARVPGMPRQGGVGIAVWDPTLGTARLMVSRFAVTELP